MTKVAITEQYLIDIADAIREKTGLDNVSYRPSEMASAIMTISGSGGITPTGTISITKNGSYNVTPYASAEVNVPTGSTINNQNKSIEPTEVTQEVTYDDGYTGLGTVTVGAISSTYVGSGITRNPTPTASEATVTIPVGYYSTQATKSVATATHAKPTASINSETGLVTASHTQTAGYVSAGTTTGTLQLTTQAASTITPSTSSQTAVAAGKYTLGAVTVAAVPTETKTVTTNGDVTPSSGKFLSKVTVNVPTGSTINNQDKTVNPSTSKQTITADSGYTGLGTVTVNAMSTMTLPTTAANSATSGYTKKLTISRSTAKQYVNIPTGYNSAGAYYEVEAVANGTAGTPVATKGTVSNNSITVTPSVTNSTGYITGGTKTGTAATVTASELVSGTLEITANGTKDVTNYKNVTINVPTGSTINNQNKSVTPTESQQSVTADSGYTGLGTVTVGAISSTYVGSEIAKDPELIVWDNTVTVPEGYYSTQVQGIVSSMTLPTSAASSATSGYTSKATIGRSTSAQYINIPPGYNSAGAYYVISAVANGSATAPSSISGSSATVTTGTNTITLTKTVSVTPSVTAGYVSSGTAGNSSVSLTASVTVNPTPTVSGATVTIPAGYYTEATSKAVSTMTLPTSATTSGQGNLKATIDRSTSDQYINIPTGYNGIASTYKISAVANGSATGPTSLSGSSATVTTGTNTITLTKTGVTTTPTVNAGYVSSATASTATVALTASVTTKAAATYTPGTTNQTIAAGTYLTGTQTIAGDEDLVSSNIVSGVQIFGVTGNVVLQNYYTGSSAPSSSLGQNGDIYIQQ